MFSNFVSESKIPALTVDVSASSAPCPSPPHPPPHVGGLHVGGLSNNFNTVALCLLHIDVFGFLRGGIVLGGTI